MARDLLGKGWKFPVGVGPDGKIAMSERSQDVEESIRIILGTAKGERAMRPDFGCGIHELVFRSINAATINLVENDVHEALTLWEPRIELIEVNANGTKAKNGQLLVNIEYRIRDTGNKYNLVYPFYLNPDQAP